jgi:hypothetical protein
MTGSGVTHLFIVGERRTARSLSSDRAFATRWLIRPAG